MQRLLRADESTIAELRAVREALRQELDRIERLTKHYPVICTFAGQRRVFKSRQDALDLIEELTSAVSQYERGH